MKIKYINLLLFFTSLAFCGDVSNGGHENNNHLPIYSILPFLGILLSIALIPLILSKFCHNHFGKISASSNTENLTSANYLMNKIPCTLFAISLGVVFMELSPTSEMPPISWLRR